MSTHTVQSPHHWSKAWRERMSGGAGSGVSGVARREILFSVLLFLHFWVWSIHHLSLSHTHTHRSACDQLTSQPGPYTAALSSTPNIQDPPPLHVQLTFLSPFTSVRSAIQSQSRGCTCLALRSRTAEISLDGELTTLFISIGFHRNNKHCARSCWGKDWGCGAVWGNVFDLAIERKARPWNQATNAHRNITMSRGQAYEVRCTYRGISQTKQNISTTHISPFSGQINRLHKET